MNSFHYKFEREITVAADVEITVVGAGPAGLAAAVSAARSGRKVLLAEQTMCVGGMAAGGLVGPFMTCSDPAGTKKLIRGFYEELMDRMAAEGGAEDPMGIPHCDGHSAWHEYGHGSVGPFNSETLKYVGEQMCIEAGVRLLYGVRLAGVSLSPGNSRIETLIFDSKEGLTAVRTLTAIDCTGDGDLAAMAGVPMVKGDDSTGEMQAAGLFFLVSGIDEDILRKRCESMGWESMRFEKEIAEARSKGEYPIPRTRLGLYKRCDGTWRANVTRIPDVDGTKNEDLTKIMITGREQVHAAVRFLRKYVHGCENLRLCQSAGMPGVRETRRIRGEFVMTGKSITGGEVFPDRILACSNSMDNHFGMVGKYIPSKVSYTVPYRVLVPRKVTNLLAAGRCVSCDRAVLSAIRVMPPCFAMGQAAGTAAAIAVESGKPFPEIDVPELQRRLRLANAVLDF